ncbi:MAG: DUF885 domain-containing protein [Steroidobacteraceae bacterium]
MLRTALKWIAGLLGVALLAALLFLINLIWFRPFSLNLFYEKAFLQAALRSPETLTSLGIAEQYGYRRHNAHLDDLSLAKEARDLEITRASLHDLEAYDIAKQTAKQQLATRILRWYLRGQVEGQKFQHHDYPVNQMFGIQSQQLDFMISIHQIDDRRGAEDFLLRLEELPRKFDQLIEQLQAREKRGVVPPRFVIERVLTEMRAFEGKYVPENPLCVHFGKRINAIIGRRETEANYLWTSCLTVLETHVRPAYRTLIKFFDGQLQRATNDDGVWKLPDGDAYYAYRLRMETSTRMTPQAVHDLGLAEVARIDGEMRTILAAQHELRKGETPAQALARLRKESRFLYPNDATGRAAALADYKRMIAEQLELSRIVIGVLPKAPIEVQRVPEFREKTASGAYYMLPSLDGSRPGIFFANLRDMNEVPKFQMRTLAVHEGVPGHHMQIALAMEQQDVPTFRKALTFNAYAEGWALYAEWLAVELGLYEGDPWGNLGRLQAEMFRSVRLVVDTGIHFKRWPREQAIAYMVEKTGMAEAAVVSEVERYVVMPGQACSYKVGMLALQAARRRAQERLGARWDPAAEKAFHDKVLALGSVPLEILDEQVDAWIAARLAH